MERYLAKISPLLVEPDDGRKSVCRVFTAKPPAEREVAVGKLFGLAELSPANQNAATLLDRLLEEVRAGTYPSTPPPVAQAPTAPTLEDSFQTVLQRANATVAEFLERGGGGVKLDRSTMLLGIVRQQQLVVTTVGPVSGFLFHYRPRQAYQLITITAGGEPEPINPLRLFTQTIGGTIGPLDYVFFCNSSVLDYLSLPTITAAVTGSAGPDAIRQLKLTIAKANPREPALGVIINLVLQHAAPATPASLRGFDYASAASRDTMRELSRTQQRTTRLLAPRLIPDLPQLYGWLRDTTRRYLQRIRTATHPSRPAASRHRWQPTVNASRAAIANLGRRCWQGLVKVGGWVQLRLQHPAVAAIGRTLAQLWISGWRRFRRQPLGRQVVLVVSLILAGFLTYNLTVMASRQAARAKDQAFAAVLAAVEQARSDAQGALIYQDEGRTRQSLRAALRLLDQLPADFRQHPTVARHRRELNDQLQTLRHEVRLADPLQLANFANLAADAKVPPVLLPLGRTLQTQDASTNARYVLQLDSRRIEQLPAPALTVAPLRSAAAARGNMLLLDAEGRLLQLSPRGRLTLVPLDVPDGTSAAVGVFRERLYLLVPSVGMIFRADPTAGGYSRPRRWISDGSVELNDAVDLAIDGEVYVLTTDGAIRRLRQGRAIDFRLGDIDPPLSQPTKIKTTEGSSYLYLLDPPTKRLVVVGKDNGQLVQQYSSPLFDQLLDVVVDEAERSLYLLNGTRIYGVPMEHLEQ